MRSRYLRYIGALALALAAGCSKKEVPAAEPVEGESKAIVAAETALATAQPFVETIGAIGTVEARVGHFATLSAPAPTRVSNVLVAAGQTVAKGDILVELEQTGFQSMLKSAKATRTSAQAARDRLQRLVDQGITPRRDLDQAVADLAKADADVVAASRLADLAVLRAPLTGVVTRVNAALGASVDPAQVLVEIADPSTVDVLLMVQPGDAARIHVGNAVALHAGQRSSGDSLAHGQVVDISAIVDSASRSVAVRVRTTGGKRPLRIGETLFGQITVAIRPKAVTVPLAALVPDGDGYKVFVVDAVNLAHARPVNVGGKTDSMAEILDGRLQAGERVVTYGAFGVEDGAKIVAPGKRGAAAPKDSTEKP